MFETGKEILVKPIIMFSCPLQAAGFDLKLIIYALIVVSGCLISLIIWISDMSRLIRFSTPSRSVHRYLLWTFIIPWLNLLWIPWALIFSSFFTRKAQEKHVSQYLFNPGAGITILSVPLLIMYLFWGTIVMITFKSLLRSRNEFEIFIYASIVVVCFLIVFVSYLIYFSVFVHRLGILEKRLRRIPKTH